MTPEEILEQIVQIREMVEGSISPYGSNDARRTYHNLSSYVGGKNTKNVREDQIPRLEHLIKEHKRFRDLVKAYELAIIRRTRAELGIPLKRQ